MNETHEAFCKLYDAVRDGVTAMVQDFKDPDDDWLPTAFFVDGDDRMGLISIDTDFMEDEVTKTLLAEHVLPKVIRENSAIAAAFVSSAWQADYINAEAALKTLSPKNRPDRREVVMVVCVSTFEAKACVIPIIRAEDMPPVLGEWEDIREGFEGLFPSGLRSGLVHQG